MPTAPSHSTLETLAYVLDAQGMEYLARRLYNGGFNHLKRRTASLILGPIPRSDAVAQPLQARLICMPHLVPQVNVRLLVSLSGLCAPTHEYLRRFSPGNELSHAFLSRMRRVWAELLPVERDFVRRG